MEIYRLKVSEETDRMCDLADERIEDERIEAERLEDERLAEIAARPDTVYTCIGSVRGGCGHKHQSLRAAEACLERDKRDCRAAGGYSDRSTEMVAAEDIPDYYWG